MEKRSVNYILIVIFFLSYPTYVRSQGEYFKTGSFLRPGKPGPWVQQTHGQVWPKPKSIKVAGQNFSVVSAAEFTFEHPYYVNITSSAHFRGVISNVEVVMKNHRGCEQYPHHEMDEHYEIKVDSPDEPQRARIIAFSSWGILRGLESFSQLVHIDSDLGGIYRINSLQLLDSPRFSWRGILIDSSRHFLSKRVIFEQLDLMEINKYNVLHWHITDDNSFPYESVTFPNMSLHGAYRPYTHVYSHEDVKEIIEYARLRGIRVVSEFDTPGHTQSWELGHPGILTKCYHAGAPNGLYGPMNPLEEKLYPFLHKFFKEVGTVFPDKYMHLGGDEVDMECWRSNPKILDFVKKKFKGDFKKLESYYVQRLLNIIEHLPTNNGYIVWQEVFDNGDKVKNDTIIEIWKGSEAEWRGSMSRVTKTGLRAILSAPWYLNYISYGTDWPKYYTVEPLNFQGTEAQKRLVMGGEACMWGEFVNSINLIPLMWPRASAVGERLWSPEDVRDVHEAAKRLQEHECRMLQRGFGVQPANGAGFCDVLWEI